MSIVGVFAVLSSRLRVDATLLSGVLVKVVSTAGRRCHSGVGHFGPVGSTTQARITRTSSYAGFQALKPFYFRGSARICPAGMVNVKREVGSSLRSWSMLPFFVPTLNHVGKSHIHDCAAAMAIVNIFVWARNIILSVRRGLIAVRR